MLSIKQITEALIFASPKPLSIEEIRRALRAAAADSEDLEILSIGEISEEEIASQINLLRAEYEQTARAIQLTEQANGWVFTTRPSAADWVRQLYPETRPARLSAPALETLAIIAYRQPVTRADIEAVRGVAVDGVMQVLLDRSLVKIAGRAELPGRPLLYETTAYFLEHFGLKATEELPNSDELRRIALPKAENPSAENLKKGRKKLEEPPPQSNHEEPPTEPPPESTPAGDAAMAPENPPQNQDIP